MPALEPRKSNSDVLKMLEREDRANWAEHLLEETRAEALEVHEEIHDMKGTCVYVQLTLFRLRKLEISGEKQYLTATITSRRLGDCIIDSELLLGRLSPTPKGMKTANNALMFALSFPQMGQSN